MKTPTNSASRKRLPARANTMTSTTPTRAKSSPAPKATAEKVSKTQTLPAAATGNGSELAPILPMPQVAMPGNQREAMLAKRRPMLLARLELRLNHRPEDPTPLVIQAARWMTDVRLNYKVVDGRTLVSVDEDEQARCLERFIYLEEVRVCVSELYPAAMSVLSRAYNWARNLNDALYGTRKSSQTCPFCFSAVMQADPQRRELHGLVWHADKFAKLKHDIEKLAPDFPSAGAINRVGSHANPENRPTA